MKRIKLYGLSILLLASIFACTDDLNTKPKVELSLEQLLQQDPNAITGIMSKLYGSFALSGPNGPGSSDISDDPGESPFLRGIINLQEFTADGMKNRWGDNGLDQLTTASNWDENNKFFRYLYNRVYYTVPQCNNLLLVLNNVDVPNKQSVISEVRFLRSLAYYYMIDCFGKGVLVTPTVHGNLLLGPDSQDILDKEDKATTTEQLEFIKERATKSVKNISLREVIRTFAGLRAESDTEDFVIKNTNNFIDVAGIKSPGLSAAPAIAEDVSKMVVEILENPLKKEDFNPFRKKQIRFMELSNENKKEIIKKDSSYGRIICRCENITEGEIIDSIHRNIGATTVDGVKRRCRPGMGRCQGGFCGPRIQEILAKELNKPLESIVLDGENSYILTGETKK